HKSKSQCCKVGEFTRQSGGLYPVIMDRVHKGTKTTIEKTPVFSTHAEQLHPGIRLCPTTQSINQRRVGGWSGSFWTTCGRGTAPQAHGFFLSVQSGNSIALPPVPPQHRIADVRACPHVLQQLGSLNFSQFVARQIGRRRGVSPRYGRAHRLQRREPLPCL